MSYQKWLSVTLKGGTRKLLNTYWITEIGIINPSIQLNEGSTSMPEAYYQVYAHSTHNYSNITIYVADSLEKAGKCVDIIAEFLATQRPDMLIIKQGEDN